MEAAVHLPQLDLADRPVDGRRLARVVDAARDLGFVGVSANDHLTFSRPWTDGLVLLAAAAARSGSLELMTSVALPTLRGPHPYAAAMRSLERIAAGRVVAGIGAGSSPTDHALAGVPWDARWRRLDDAIDVLRTELHVEGATVPLWIASWGSAAGMRRVARYGDGWVASAFHGGPDSFGRGRALLTHECARRGRPEPPHALVTMWTWITDRPHDAERVVSDVLAPILGRDPATLRDRVCVGSAETCAALLSAYAAQGCRRVHFWPVADEPEQLRRLAEDVLPRVASTPR